MMYQIDHFQQITGGSLLTQQPSNTAFKWLATDTRQIINGPQSLFIALKGPFHNAHQYLAEALNKGVTNFVISEPPPLDIIDRGNWLLVKDTLVAMQQIAAEHRKRFQLPIVGITGSNGKTWVKEWLCQLLDGDMKIARSPKSYNSQVGVPLSVWSLNENHEIGIFEAGISQPGEMSHLEKIIQPSIGIFTYLGDAHSVNFRNREQKLEEKWELFKNCEKVVCSLDQIETRNFVQKESAESDSIFTWSSSPDRQARVLIQSVKTGDHTVLSFEQTDGNYRGKVEIPFDDEVAIWNASTCIAFLLAMDMDPAAHSAEFAALEPIGMRMELVEGKAGSLLINDSYNADMEGLKMALGFMSLHSGGRKKIAVISDLMESGSLAADRHAQIAELLDLFKVDICYALGKEISPLTYVKGLRCAIRPCNDTEEVEFQLNNIDLQDTIILFKAARKFRLERVCESLEQVTHLTELEIRLDALRHNLEFFRNSLSEGTKLIAVIKAAAYGIGSREIARFLEQVNIDRLAVAYTDEGLELRKLGVVTPILVLNPDPSTFDLMLSENLEPEIHSLTRLQQWIHAQDNSPYQVAIHLKLETGMHRLGIDENDIDQLCAVLSERPDLIVASVMTHLSASDDPELDTFSHHQIDLFLALYSHIVRTLGYQPERHVLNSNGILRFPDYHFECVRLGIGLYGTGIVEKEKLRPVHRLVSRIAQLKNIHPGDSVGYNRSFIADKNYRVATINLGYADGLPRVAGNGKFAVDLKGNPCPILGDVCMDMTMIDVTDVPDVHEGDEVVIFGPENPIENLCLAAGTIPYEILTGIGTRVKRRFIEE